MDNPKVTQKERSEELNITIRTVKKSIKEKQGKIFWKEWVVREGNIGDYEDHLQENSKMAVISHCQIF